MSIRDRLRADLKTALKERDRVAASTIRTALAAIENAEAVDAVEVDGTDPMGTVGLSRDVSRRALSPTDIRDILRREVDERQQAISTYETTEQHPEADRLRTELRVLERYVED
ncbi:MAG: hypothetical protein GEV07_30215 [Streptosporangiales bacterium]|nr:hypothetical protein [Streptosporangiales bacterium]